MHGDFALHLDAIKVLHGLGGGLPEQRQGHEQLACPPGVLRMLGALKVLQSLVEGILEPLDGLDVLYVHGVWSKEQKTGGKESLLVSNPHNRFNPRFLNADVQQAAATCNFGERFSPLNG